MKIPRFASMALIPLIASWAIGACGDDEDDTQPTTASSSVTGSSTTSSTGSGGSGGTGTTTSAGPGGAGGSGGGMPDLVLSNAPSCQDFDYIFPLLPEEASHVAATRLTPSAAPFVVERVSYTLAGQTEFSACDGGLAHRVDVWVESWDPNDPYPVEAPSMQAVHASFDVPADPAAHEPGRTVELALDPPMNLEEGDVIFVGVEMASNRGDTASLCIQGCSDTNGIDGLDFWSNDASEPYDMPGWSDMVADYGFTSNFTISAVGKRQ
jgi:hypothetical protein